jgi:hypothetical protein
MDASPRELCTSFFEEQTQDGSIKTLEADTKEQKADIFTKAMDGPTFKTICRILQGWQG